MTELKDTQKRFSRAKVTAFLLLLAPVLLWGQAKADTSLISSGIEKEIRVDGSLSEWQGVPVLQLTPSASNITVNGEFKEADFDFKIQSVWNKQYLYLAIQWQDDIWDIEEISRKEATWHDPDTGQKRDRMYFFDNFKLHIRDSDYDYTLWISPKDQENGPYTWSRLLMGYRGNERAGAKPMLRSESDGNATTLEMMIVWKQLQIKPKNGLEIPIRLTISDSDLPGRFEESKINEMKSVEWAGNLTLID